MHLTSWPVCSIETCVREATTKTIISTKNVYSICENYSVITTVFSVTKSSCRRPKGQKFSLWRHLFFVDENGDVTTETNVSYSQKFLRNHYWFFSVKKVLQTTKKFSLSAVNQSVICLWVAYVTAITATTNLLRVSVACNVMLLMLLCSIGTGSEGAVSGD